MKLKEARKLVGQKRKWEMTRINGAVFKTVEVTCTHVEGKAVIDAKGKNNIEFAFAWCTYGKGEMVWFTPEQFQSMPIV